MVHHHSRLPTAVLDHIVGFLCVQRDGHLWAGEINAVVMGDVGLHLVSSACPDIWRPLSGIIRIIRILDIEREVQVGIVVAAP